jgi:hypothetical protein
MKKVRARSLAGPARMAVVLGISLYEIATGLTLPELKHRLTYHL